jgi:hypothetical protein
LVHFLSAQKIVINSLLWSRIAKSAQRKSDDKAQPAEQLCKETSEILFAVFLFAYRAIVNDKISHGDLQKVEEQQQNDESDVKKRGSDSSAPIEEEIKEHTRSHEEQPRKQDVP